MTGISEKKELSDDMGNEKYLKEGDRMGVWDFFLFFQNTSHNSEGSCVYENFNECK